MKKQVDASSYTTSRGTTRWDDPRLKPKLSQHATDKMRAHAGLHANNASRQRLKSRLQRQPFDLFAQNAMTRVIKADYRNCPLHLRPIFELAASTR